MASLFLNPPSPSSSSNLFTLKKNPTSTTTFSRFPLLKNPNLSLFRPPKTKTNSRKLLKFSANNTNNNEEEEEETKKIESSSMVNPLKEDDESKKTRNESNKLKRSIFENFLAELKKTESSSLKEDSGSKVRNESNELEGSSIFEDLDKRDNTLAEQEKFIDNFFRKWVQSLIEWKKSLNEWEQFLNEEITKVELRIQRKIDQMEEDGLFIDDPSFRSRYKAIVRSEKELLEKHDEAFGELDVNKLKSCFGFDTFFAREVRRDGYRWEVVGKLSKPIEEVRPQLEKKIFEAIGKEVVLFFIENETKGIKEQVCLVELKSRMDLHLENKMLNTTWGYTLALVLCIATFGTIASMIDSFPKPDAAVDNYLAKAVPLFGGLFSILGVSEIATRITAARYGVKLSPSFLIPSYWTGFLGVVNKYESLLPNKKAHFDIPVARSTSAYLMSAVLMITSFVANGSFNGGANPLYISPEFFSGNPSISFIQSVVGPYTDLGIALPYTVEGMGVPVDPLVFAGLLGFAVTSLNLLPCESLEGGRIAQVLFERDVATFLSNIGYCILLFGSLNGNALCLACVIVSFFRYEEEIPAKDEITPLGDERYTLGFILSVICFLTFFPNCAGTLFSISLPSLPFF